MNFAKLCWGVRAVFYKVRFKSIGIPSYIGKPIFISNTKNISCGKRVRIYPGMRVEIVDNNSFITIGNNVSIGQNFHIVSYNDNLTIGNDVVIAGNVFITNCDHDYKGPHASVLENQLIGRHTIIGNGCFIGNNAVILAGSELGAGCIVGANSVVRGIYPSNSVIVGAPAKEVKKYTKQ